MSSTEFHSGKAKKLEFEAGLTLQQKIDDLKARGFVIEDFDIEEGYVEGPKIVKIYGKDEFYELIEHFEARDEDQDLQGASLNEDGSFNFLLQFYNGGCGFDEAFEDAIKNLPVIEEPAPLTLHQKEDNTYAANILDQEGSGYAVSGYCSGDRFLDPKTKELWDKAGNAIEELERYLQDFKEEM